MQSKRLELHGTGSEQRHYMVALKGSLDFSGSQGGKVIAGKLGTELPGKGRGQLRGS